VRRELVFVPRQGYQVTPPKSAKSRRAVDISDDGIAELRRHRAEQAEHRLKIGPAWLDEDWVFTTGEGAHINPNAVSKAFKDIRVQLGLPRVRFHDLRHTHASLLLQAGVHLKVVQERLGHSTIAITADTYSHVAAGLQKAAARDFEAMLSRSEDAVADPSL